ncbi:hypothetical protein ACVW00_003837 [Marmoricola sp. URHA0025 HA25]
MTGGADWLEPLGGPGGIEVQELLHPDAWARYFAADPGVELALATLTLHGTRLEVVATRVHRSLRAGDDVLVDLDLSGDADPSGGYRRPLSLRGTAGSVELQTDPSRPSLLRGALRYLRVVVGEQTWVWHFEGGRAAGERLVLSPGAQPGDGPALVTTSPAAHGRSLGNPTGGATADTHVTSWEPVATALEVALVELLVVSRLDGLVDYRPARVAEGVSELLEVAPRPDANTE